MIHSSTESRIENRREHLVAELQRLLPHLEEKYIKKRIRRFFSDFKAKYINSQYSMARLKSTYPSWLALTINFESESPKETTVSPPAESPKSSASTSSAGETKPLTGEQFMALSPRQQQRRAERLRSKISVEELQAAAASAYEEIGKRSIARKIRNIGGNSEDQQVGMGLSPEEALQMMLEAKLTVTQYQKLKTLLDDLLPSYQRVLAAKEALLPEDINATSPGVNK